MTERERMESLANLMRSPEEESVERERHGNGPLELRFGMPGKESVFYGTSHEFSKQPIEGMIAAFENHDPDLILVEGGIEDDGKTDGAKILETYGEQRYMAWLARKRGVEVQSWDVPSIELLKNGLEKHGFEVTAAWMIAYGSKHLFKRGKGKQPDSQSVREMLKFYFSDKNLAELGNEWVGIEDLFDSLDIDALSKRYLGKPLSELTPEDAEYAGTPWHRGTTNDVLRDWIALRDRRAIELIDRAKKEGKKIFVTAGLDHVLTWEPALEAMYEKTAD